MVLNLKNIQELNHIVCKEIFDYFQDLRIIKELLYTLNNLLEYEEIDAPLYMLTLTEGDNNYHFELIKFEYYWYFINFDYNLSSEDIFNISDYGYDKEDRVKLIKSKYEKEFSQFSCQISSDLLKARFKKYNINESF